MGYSVNELVKTGGVPMHLIKPLLADFNVPYFIETGSAGGESAKEASKYFKNVYTIELRAGRQNIENTIFYKNINWYEGHSHEKLIDVISDIKSANNTEELPLALFYLDAHYDGDKPADSKDKDCYLLEEIEVIAEKYGQNAIIIIDDARLFLGHPPAPNDPRQWPTIQKIFKSIDELFEYHIATVTDDYIIAYPDRVQDPFNNEWRKNYHLRYPDEKRRIKNVVRGAWVELQKYLEDGE